MNLFRVPLNIYVIIVLLIISYLNPFTVALITALMCFLAFGIGLFLVIYNSSSEKIIDINDFNMVLPIAF